MHIAVQQNNKDIISLITHNGGDPTVKDSNGMSAEDIALIDNKIDLLELMQNC